MLIKCEYCNKPVFASQQKRHLKICRVYRMLLKNKPEISEENDSEDSTTKKRKVKAKG